MGFGEVDEFNPFGGFQLRRDWNGKRFSTTLRFESRLHRRSSSPGILGDWQCKERLLASRSHNSHEEAKSR
ncbi:hypothetical protein IGI04_018171 [Brassica rapa subsp. trilocularis]|uniref:Uncharacterized protein n=1 Tax=Brassica rapa subsp. trilocularis TaxID=1813537 RepID=A0ABQ7MCL4_BRACM|nr:hypothetical protein IGI04_018171 [Brassica rapa subsp. trilocularis]